MITPCWFRFRFLQSCIDLLPALVFSVVLFPAAAGADWTDPAGDVTLSNADIVSGSATVSGGMVDLRVQFANAPFPNTATHHLHWFFDLDQNTATGENYPGASVFGVEKFISIDVRLSTGTFDGCEIVLWSPISGVDYHSHLWFDPGSNTLRLFFPASLLQDDGIFNYALHSAFGGSFGANERAPDGGTVTSTTNVLAPFNGILWCPSENDSDRDSVPDDKDQCPNTAPGSAVNEHGCSIDQLVPCAGPATGGTWRNHGQYVVAVARAAAAFHSAGLITTREKRAIVRAALWSGCGRRHHGWR